MMIALDVFFTYAYTAYLTILQDFSQSDKTKI